jgi:hypothetical protein
MTVPVPTMCRLEYLTPDGTWSTAHAHMALLDPGKYVIKVSQRRPTRALELAENLQPTGVVFEVLPLPDPCDLCGKYLHAVDGECLL